MFREFLVSWLRAEGYEVVGEAKSLAEANALSESVEMDLVLLDLDLPDGDGLRYVERQMARRPNTRILVLTAHAGGVLQDLVPAGGTAGEAFRAGPEQ